MGPIRKEERFNYWGDCMKLRRPLNKKYGFKIRSYQLIIQNLSRLLENQELRIPHIEFEAISPIREQTDEERAKRMSVPIQVQLKVKYKSVDTQEVITEVGRLLFRQ